MYLQQLISVAPGILSPVSYSNTHPEPAVKSRRCPALRPPTGILSFPMPIMDVNEIRQILPHRYPFLLVDRIVELEAERIVGIKNVTVNEPFFTGHFPDFPVMPGVLIIEAMAQTAGVLVLKSIPDRDNKLVLLVSVDGARFRKPVVPGDQLRIEMTTIRRKGTVAKMTGRATVDGVLVAEAEVMCSLQDKPPASV
jgi:3-hydroxyacyl-[acyl-carrier-protein] dehydratase